MEKGRSVGAVEGKAVRRYDPIKNILPQVSEVSFESQRG